MSIKIICIVFNLLPEINEASLRVTQTSWQYLEVILPATLPAQSLFCSSYTWDSSLSFLGASGSKWHWGSAWEGGSSWSCWLHISPSLAIGCSASASVISWMPLCPPVHPPDWGLNTEFKPPVWPNSYFLGPCPTSWLTDWDLLERKSSPHSPLCSAEPVRLNLPCPKDHYQVEEGQRAAFMQQDQVGSEGPCFFMSKDFTFCWDYLRVCLRSRGGVSLRAYSMSCPSQVLRHCLPQIWVNQEVPNARNQLRLKIVFITYLKS